MTAPAVVAAFRRVGKSYPTPRGAVEVLREVDLELRRGDFVVLSGPSGSGKTTLLNLLGLLDEPTSGQLLLEGRDVSALAEAERCRVRGERIGMIFQRFFLLPHRSALRNVAFRFRYLPVPEAEARRRAAEALARFDLTRVADVPARLLSGGEMQRVAIARAVVGEPSMLLADEPTGNLDPASARNVMDTLAGLHRQGMTILLATHNLQWLSCASRHWICEAGAIRESA